MDITKNEHIISMAIVKESDQIITISENGFGKKTPISEFRLTARGAKGVKAGIFNEKTGKIISLVQANEDEDLMLIADNGIMIRIPVNEISLVGRVSQGVKVMRLKDNAKLVCVAKTLSEKDEGEEGENAGEEKAK